jgi:large subunit ribosomal protein L21e
MAKRIGGSGRKTRGWTRKNVRKKGKISLTKYFQTFEIGDGVVLKAEPAIRGGLYNRRLHGRTGIISGQRGRCYFVDVNDKGKDKKVIVHPVHLKRL